MKILHTADWHIGKSLYKHDLYEDILLFFEELIEIIDEESVEILLISGDIFDLANPSNRDKEIYYSFLNRLMKKNLRVVITAGNHDSVRMLEAPKSLLKQLNIDIVGEAGNLAHQVLNISNEKGQEICCILPIPFLRDRDIRQVLSGEKYQDKIEATRKGIIAHYEKVKAYAQKIGQKGPFIALGHLYVQGASLSDSEREIQIGNTAGISVESFKDSFDYMALGHIHRPQKLNKNGTIRYSGSPIALSFSERKDEKKVILLSIENGKIKNIVTKNLTKYRGLKRLTGTVDELKAKLENFQNETPLLSFIELHAQEAEKDNVKIVELINIASKDSDRYKVVHYKIQFDQQQNSLLSDKNQLTIEEMKPIDVFRSKLEDEIQDDKTKKGLEAIFFSLLQDLEES